MFSKGQKPERMWFVQLIANFTRAQRVRKEEERDEATMNLIKRGLARGVRIY